MSARLGLPAGKRPVALAFGVLLLSACGSAAGPSSSLFSSSAGGSAGPTQAEVITPGSAVATASPTQPAPTGTAPVVGDWTAPEKALLAGMRGDVVASACHPVRDQLPAGATAGVGCDIGSALVDGVGFYQFTGLDALMSAYQTRLAEYGIPLATDVPQPGQLPKDCWRGYASESYYWPTGDVSGGKNRAGCFINEYGFANLRYVWGRSLVYVGVLGNNGDMAGLQAWAWYDAQGEEPSLGGPGVWQPRP